MRTALVFSIIMLLSSLACTAQALDSLKVIGIHPAVGKIIDRQEKIRYKLLPEYNDSLFDQGKILMAADSSYTLEISLSNGKTLRRGIESAELDGMYASVQRLQVVAAADMETKEEEKQRRRDERIRDTTVNVFLTVLEVGFTILLALANN